MNAAKRAARIKATRWSRAELLLVAWIALALASLAPAASLVQGYFPIFTVVWLAGPLVAVLRGRDARGAGFRSLTWPEFGRATALNLGLLLALMALLEPWSHTYRLLVEKATAGPQPDPTFAWIVRYQGAPAWGGMLLFSGLVTLFAEELFFRGWLLQWLLSRLPALQAIAVQAALFVLPNLLVALVMPPLQGTLYVVGYTWLGIGVVGGWTAARTRSIWPSLVSATACNLLLTALVQ